MQRNGNLERHPGQGDWNGKRIHSLQQGERRSFSLYLYRGSIVAAGRGINAGMAIEPATPSNKSVNANRLPG